MDFSIKKNIRVAESVSLEFQGVFANVLNHNQWTDTRGLGSMGHDGPGISVLSGFSSGNNGEAEPRKIEVGVRVRF